MNERLKELALQVDLMRYPSDEINIRIQKFAELVRADEREKVAQWMMDKGYATGHGDSIEDLLKEIEWQVAERERNACAKVCDVQAEKDKFEGCYANACAEAIRARGET